MIRRNNDGNHPMRTGKILGLILGAVAAVIVIVPLTVLWLVNPNDFKPRIVAAVKRATGRDLALQGDIHLRVFPWIALELGPASLGNPKGFPGEPFVSFGHAVVRAKLLPLLRKRLEVGRIELDGLDLKLLENAQGQGNWQGFGSPQGPEAAATPVSPGEGPETLLGIAGIQITRARVSYGSLLLENVSLETGAFASQGEVPITLHVDADRGVPTERASVDARFDFSGDMHARRYRLSALQVNGDVALAHNNRPVRWHFAMPVLDADLGAQTVNAGSLAVDLAGAQFTGSLQGTSILRAPNFTGSLALAPLVVREFLPRIGFDPPRTRDPKAFSSVSASTTFVYGGNAARLDKLQVTLDDTHLNGSVAVTNLETWAIEFALAVDKIDADGYLAPEGTPATAAASLSVPPAGAPTKSLNAKGTLTLGSVHLSPLDLADVHLSVTAADQVIHVFPVLAQVNGGRYSGDITWDGRGSTPTLSLDEHLTGIEVGKLLSSGGKSGLFSGRGNVNLKASGRGNAAGALVKTLDGHVDVDVSDGALEGIDLGFELGRAEALLRRQDMPAVQNTRRTKFTAMKMSAQITNGVAQTKDLTLASPVLKVTGQGTLNLASKAVDFSLLADTLKTAGNTPIQIPVKVTGSVADPVVRPDVDALVRGQLKQKVQDVLQDKLKGLFNR